MRTACSSRCRLPDIRGARCVGRSTRLAPRWVTELVNSDSFRTSGATTCKVGRPHVVRGALNVQKNEHDSSVVVKPGGKLNPSAEYRATKPTVIKWLRSRAKVTAGTFVDMTCFGFAVGDPANNPAL